MPLLVKEIVSKPRILFLFLMLNLLFSCQPESPREYIFLGHPYDYNRLDRLDPRVEQLLAYPFDQVWFGGDMCAQMGGSPENLAYVDSLLGALPGEVHWTLGNHDIDFGPLEPILALRKRPSFYVDYRDGICLLVLNTNLFWFYPSLPPQRDCEEKAAQLELIRSVADTIREASHLIVLHHHGLLTEMLVDSTGELLNPFNINALSIRATCDSTSLVNEVIYPELVKVQQRGVQVVLIGGDMGMMAKEFSYRTPAGIRVLGSGINNSLPREYAPDYVTNFDPDEVLWLHHWPRQRRLEWRFVSLDSLVNGS